jgi:hypothetical protein
MSHFGFDLRLLLCHLHVEVPFHVLYEFLLLLCRFGGQVMLEVIHPT